MMCRENSHPHGYLELVSQAIAFKAFFKLKLTNERFSEYSKVDQIVNPGDYLKDFSPPQSHRGHVILTHLLAQELRVSACAASHQG